MVCISKLEARKVEAERTPSDAVHGPSWLPGLIRCGGGDSPCKGSSFRDEPEGRAPADEGLSGLDIICLV
jgi:hypothetical protein